MWWGRFIEITFCTNSKFKSKWNCASKPQRQVVYSTANMEPRWSESQVKLSWEHKKIDLRETLIRTRPRWTPLVPWYVDERLSWPEQQYHQVRDDMSFCFQPWIGCICWHHSHQCIIGQLSFQIYFPFISSLDSAAFVDIIHTNGDLTPSAATLWVAA